MKGHEKRFFEPITSWCRSNVTLGASQLKKYYLVLAPLVLQFLFLAYLIFVQILIHSFDLFNGILHHFLSE